MNMSSSKGGKKLTDFHGIRRETYVIGHHASLIHISIVRNTGTAKT